MPKTKQPYKYQLVTWERYLALRGFKNSLSPVGTCHICWKSPAAYVVMYDVVGARLLTELTSRGFADICSEECFNLWLLRNQI